MPRRTREAIEMGLCSKMLHKWAEFNIITRPNGVKTCRACRNISETMRRRGGYIHGPSGPRGSNGRSLEERFFSKVQADDALGCWTWTGAKLVDGYGRFACFGPTGERTFMATHRWVYEFMVAPIPEGLEIDHLCRNPSCVNPYHLEPVTKQENLRRKNELSDEEHRALIT